MPSGPDSDPSPVDHEASIDEAGPPEPDDDVALRFPDLPRLELDELLGQLVDRAQEVMGTQGRLRGLLRANQAIIGDLALPVVLRRIVEAARELVGAQYAALGVIAPDGHLAEFVHDGMSGRAVERIGHLPQGKGLLGALIDDPRPIRLECIQDDERSSGFPADHPPMDSFLGVPIRVRDTVFGNLYLAESTKGRFSSEDEELAAALAATAGMVIDNARLFETLGARQEWLRASATVTRRLLSGGADDAVEPLRLIAERCRDLSQADLVTVIRPAPDGGELRVEIAVGNADADSPVGVRVPLEGSLAGRVFTTAEPLRASSPDQPGLATMAVGRTDLGPVLLLPLLGSQRVHGVLTAARVRGKAVFSEEDLDMAAGFANQASVAIELAEARAEQQRAEILGDRDRIAADLHDHVIQRLFGTGLSLHGVASMLGPGTAKDRVLTAVKDLDDTISQIRTTIYQLGQAASPDRGGIRARLLEVVIEQTPALGFEPSVRFTGVLEQTLPEDVVEDLLAALREALSNVARHARARSAAVAVTASTGQVRLGVTDDGVGVGPITRLSGLANLRRRAEQHGGSFTIAAGERSGTELTWSARFD
jgi:signal transduction histidine kinase